MRHFVFVLFGVVLATVLDQPIYGASIFILLFVVTALLNKDDPNIVHLCLGMTFIILVEKLVFLFVPIQGTPQVWINNRIYLIHVIFDFLFFTFLIFRGAISRALYQKLNRSTEGLHLTNADISLFGVMILFIFVDLAATIENLLRNLEHLGFSEDIAKPLWQLNWIYYHYPQMKYGLMGLQFLVLWSTLSKMAKKKSRYASILPG